MEKVRFSCPRCRTIMQTAADKVGFDVACPNCAHRFRLVTDESDSGQQTNTPRPLTSKAAVDGDAVTTPPRVSPVPNLYEAVAQTPVKHSPANNAWSCPYCQTTKPPVWKSEVSQLGWIVFVILLVTTCVFCFAGLFIRDKFRVCSQCKIRLD